MVRPRSGNENERPRLQRQPWPGKHLRALLILLAAFLTQLLLACGQDDPSPSKPTAEAASVPATELELLLRAAEGGDEDAMRALVESYDQGIGVPEDQQQAARWLTKLVEFGAAEDQYALANRYYDNRGVISNPGRGAKLLALAAEQGMPLAQLQYGEIHFADDLGVFRNVDTALEWMEKSANQGSSHSQNVLGEMYRWGLKVEVDNEDPLVETKVKKTLVEVNYEEALRWFLVAAAQGNAAAQISLALMYSEGIGVEKDPAQVEHWYRMAAEGGQTDAKLVLARIYDEGIGVAADPSEAARWYQSASEDGIVEAKRRVALFYLSGTGVSQDEEKGAGLMREIAELGDPEAQFVMAGLLETGRGVTQNSRYAFDWYRKAANQGHYPSQLAVFNMIREQTPVSLAPGESLKWIQSLAEGGEATAMAWLGNLLWAGTKIEQDYAKALEWHIKAADLGQLESQAFAGTRLLRSPNIKPDYDKAFHYLSLATAGGDTNVLFDLGLCFWKGWGTKRDRVKGLSYFKQSFDDGRAEAIVFLGLAARYGIEGPSDLEKAYVWFSLAEALVGSGNGKQQLDEIKKRMTPGQISSAQARVGPQLEKFKRKVAAMESSRK